MGAAARRNPTAITGSGPGRFSADLIERCEVNLCIDWAVAFERVTGWPVHLAILEDLPVRAYCEDDGNWCYDVRGMMTPLAYSECQVTPLAQDLAATHLHRFGQGQGRLGFQCLGAEGLEKFGLKADDQLVTECVEAIRQNSAYLGLVPPRPRPWMPTKPLSKWSWGGCVVYAEALSRLTGLPAAIIEATRLLPGVGIGSGEGFHSVVIHPDGELEDVWGKFPAERIAKRYGMASWTLSQHKHRELIDEALEVRATAADDIAEAEQDILAARQRAQA